MENERRNGVAEEVVVVVEEEEEEGGNGEAADGGLRSRSRKKMLLEQEGEIEGDAAVGAPVGVGHEWSVYLDAEQGAWKCQHCTWTYRKNNYAIDHVQDHDGYGQGVICVEKLPQHQFLLGFQSKGVKSLDETNGMELEKVNQLVAEKSMQNRETVFRSEHAEDFPVVKTLHGKDLKDEHQPTSEEECGRILTGQEFLSQSVEITPSDDSKPVVEMDLERILEEQETHDLYCPNCHSCITRRVILRKRKRTSRQNTLDAKREKIEPIQADLIPGNSMDGKTVESHDAEPDTGERRDTGEPDVFRCLSCLSFFIPTGTGFRLFKIFGRRGENENVQSPPQIPERHQSWIFSFFETRKHKTKESGPEKPLLAESHDGYGRKADNSERTEQQITSAASSSEAMLPGKSQNEFKEERIDVHKTNGAEDVQYSGKGVNTVSSPSPSKSLGHPPEEIKNVSISSEQLPIDIIGSIKWPIEHFEKGSIKYASIPSNQESFAFGKTETEVEKLHVSREDNEEIRIAVPEGKMEHMQEICLKGPPLTTPIAVPEGKMEHMQEICLKGPPLTTPIAVPEGKMEHMQEICLKGPPLTTPTAPGPPIIVETRIHVGEQIMAEPRQTRQWDVLKAIVYGGLLESIASLGVVSSAAGSGVTTLNVIALGLANFVSGLLVLIHNLLELKNEQYKSISDNKKEESDRYWELLGSRGHIHLHATVALISYILVGILPPILYGFSFRKSDNKEYKLIVVAGGSLLCITLLAIAKAHVQGRRKQYIKTLVYYVGLGVSASGLSYAVGMLIKKLLQELGLFDDHASLLSPPFSSILEITPRTPLSRPS